MPDKRRHHTTKHTSTVTFRPPSGAPVTVLVHGRPSEVRNQIQTALEGRQHKMTFWDLNRAKNVTVRLDDYDTWSVK